MEGKTVEFLKGSGKWGKFIAIISFISVGLILFAAISMLVLGSRISQPGLPFNPAILSIVYFVFGAITLLYSVYL